MPTDGINKQYIDASLRGVVREIVGHFNESQGAQNDRLDSLGRRFDGLETRFDGVEKHQERIDEKLDALFEEVGTRRELHNLVVELKTRGIRLDESRIFVTLPRG